MKKWMYLIFPGAMLVVFLGLYFPDQKNSEAKEAQRQVEIQRKKDAEELQRKQLEDRARADSARREAETAADIAKRDAARVAKQAADKKNLEDEIAAVQGDNDKLSKQSAELQLKLDTLNKQRDDLSREEFELAKQVQLGEVSRSNADLEIQRVVDMISTRAAQSSMAQMPAPPPSK